jgi:hypothetical protein
MQGSAERSKRQEKLLRNNILNKLWLRENTRWGKKTKRNPFLKRKITKLLILRAFFPEIHEAGDENMPRGFCGLKYCVSTRCTKRLAGSVVRNVTTRCHEVCVGVVGRM